MYSKIKVATDDFLLYIGLDGHMLVKPETSMVLNINDLIRLAGYSITLRTFCSAVLGSPIEMNRKSHPCGDGTNQGGGNVMGIPL